MMVVFGTIGKDRNISAGGTVAKMKIVSQDREGPESHHKEVIKCG